MEHVGVAFNYEYRLVAELLPLHIKQHRVLKNYTYS